MRNGDADLARSHAFYGVGFVEDDEVVREEITALAFLLLFRRAEEHEEEGVIDHDDVGGEEPLARLLEETAVGLSARLGGAEVRFAAYLRPDFRIGLEREIAERSVFRPFRPLREAQEFGLLGGGEEFCRLLQGAFEAAGAKVILPAFHERGLELDRQDLFQDRDVFIEQLLLQRDRLRGDDGFFLLLKRVKDGGHEIGDRFPDAGARLDHEMLLLVERLGDGARHLLLFRAIFEILRLREQTAG